MYGEGLMLLRAIIESFPTRLNAVEKSPWNETGALNEAAPVCFSSRRKCAATAQRIAGVRS
jgi:hypothetical protein